MSLPRKGSKIRVQAILEGENFDKLFNFWWLAGKFMAMCVHNEWFKIISYYDASRHNSQCLVGVNDSG